MTPPDTSDRRGAADEVDRIVSAWHVERPDLDTSPMSVFSRVTRLARRLDLERRRVFTDHDLEPWQFDVLSSLRRAGAPYALTPGALMNELMVSSGTTTNRIDRLEADGLVARSPSPSDRRAVLVTLTAAGRRRVDAAMVSLLDCETRLIGSLSREESATLAGLLRRLLSPFEGDAG